MDPIKKLVGALFIASSIAMGLSDIGLELLPKGRPFRLTFGDPREIRMALLYEGDSHIQAVVGNYFSIFAIKPSDDNHWALHLGLEGAGYFSLRQAESRFPLEAADGQLGIYFEGFADKWQGQLRYTHLSAHLADGSEGVAIPFSREYVSIRIAYLILPQLHAYVGQHFIINSVPPVPVLWTQWGFSLFSPKGMGKLTPFVATDFKWKQESRYNPTFNLQVGLALNNPPEAYRSFRFFYAYGTGQDPRGQFYERTQTVHSLGVEMQI
ncbi:MAG: DUF1207 domain-containing protein [Deltaproteobacteria bacterium]|nr:DUF1207 domain-containing protein [Deltaproteobacteria bacterium]